jgi:hypothetical protein
MSAKIAEAREALGGPYVARKAHRRTAAVIRA